MKVKLPKEQDGFTLYAEGALFDSDFSNGERVLTFSDKHILVLYYTFPNHRRLYMVCADASGDKTVLPCIDTPVSIIYKARGRIFDDIKNALHYLKKHSNNEYVLFPILFYRELAVLAEQKKLQSWRLKILCLKHNIDLDKIC